MAEDGTVECSSKSSLGGLGSILLAAATAGDCVEASGGEPVSRSSEESSSFLEFGRGLGGVIIGEAGMVRFILGIKLVGVRVSN